MFNPSQFDAITSLVHHLVGVTVGVDYPSVPALGVSGTLATLLTDRLAGGENVTLHWATNTTITIATTFNVLADTRASLSFCFVGGAVWKFGGCWV